MQPDVALNLEYEELYPFSKIVGKANILIMPGQHSAAISYKMMKTLGDTKVIGPLLIGLGLPVEILKEKKVDFKFDGDMQPDVALNPEYEDLYPFSKIVGKANILIMPGPVSYTHLTLPTILLV